jgi:hypothetical protein
MHTPATANQNQLFHFVRVETCKVLLLADLHDIRSVSADIERGRALLRFFPRPQPLRPCLLAALISSLYYRYVISRQENGLYCLIPILSEALLLLYRQDAQ